MCVSGWMCMFAIVYVCVCEHACECMWECVGVTLGSCSLQLSSALICAHPWTLLQNLSPSWQEVCPLVTGWLGQQILQSGRKVQWEWGMTTLQSSLCLFGASLSEELVPCPWPSVQLQIRKPWGQAGPAQSSEGFSCWVAGSGSGFVFWRSWPAGNETAGQKSWSHGWCPSRLETFEPGEQMLMSRDSLNTPDSKVQSKGQF